MPVYYYAARDASGAEVTDRVDAPGALDAIERLRARGLTVLRLQLGGYAPSPGRRGPPRWFWWVWGGMFFGIGGLFLYLLAIRPLWGVMQASGWVETPCTVLSSQLKEHSDGEDGPTYSIEVTYTYDFGGAKRQSDRYDFVAMSSNTNLAARMGVVKAYPPGKQTVCYVNPANPAEAVLKRGLTSEMWWGLFPVPFVVVGACGLLFGALGLRFPKKAAVPKDEAPPSGPS